MLVLTSVVGDNIKEKLQHQFYIVFHDWTSGNTNYVGVFATFPGDVFCSYETAHFSLAPKGDEGTMTSVNRYTFFSFVLSMYNRTIKNFVQALVRKLSNQSQAAKLRHMTPLMKNQCNTTRCILIQNMLRRFMQIKYSPTVLVLIRPTP